METGLPYQQHLPEQIHTHKIEYQSADSDVWEVKVRPLFILFAREVWITCDAAEVCKENQNPLFPAYHSSAQINTKMK